VSLAIRDALKGTGLDQYEARSWCTATSGKRARAREEVCSIISVCPDRLRNGVLKRLSGPQEAVDGRNHPRRCR
jgi:hypothetical protein